MQEESEQPNTQSQEQPVAQQPPVTSDSVTQPQPQPQPQQVVVPTPAGMPASDTGRGLSIAGLALGIVGLFSFGAT